ncbi:MAG TPA: hypothetical protein ENN40_01810 [Candidatus Aminicenantes bacterium]|nr:hypothetical protein [Candidatus Aminicenantes bacterium]
MDSQLITQCLDLYERLNRGNLDHYALLGLDRTATVATIHEAYQRWLIKLADNELATVGDASVRQRLEALRRRLDRAHAVLLDFDQRAAYERRGFREVSEVVPEEEDPQEKAKELFRKAKTLYAGKEYGPAVLALRESLRLDPDRGDALLLLGLCQYRNPAMKRDAEVNLQKAVQLEPWNAEPLVALGNLFYSEKLMKRAESFYRRALELEPGHETARRRLAEIAPPEDNSLKSTLKSAMKKGLPSLFDRKKR